MIRNKLLLSVLLLACSSAPLAAAEMRYACEELAERAPFSGFGSAVYQGDAGWFFRDGDFEHLYPVSGGAIDFLRKLDLALEVHDIDLLLMPLPPRAVMARDHAVEAAAAAHVLFDPDLAREQFAASVAALKAVGLDTVDVLGYLDEHPLPEDAFFEQDLHWRPTFADMAAAAVTATISASDNADIVGTKTFVTTHVETIKQVNRPKSNVYLNQLCSTPVEGENLDVFATTEEDASLDSFLEDESVPPVAVLGTSFTDERNPYNFGGFLRQHLGADVATYSISGGGVDTSILQWSHTGLAKAGTRILLWELPFIDRVEQLATMMQRQIIPAVVGSCEGTDNLLVSSEYALEDGRFEWRPESGEPISGEGFYLRAGLSDPSARAFTLTFHYQDGETDILPIIRPDRVTAIPDIFAEIATDIDSPLESVTIEDIQGRSNSGTVELCRYPASMSVPASDAGGQTL